jgi:hypothetical protein
MKKKTSDDDGDDLKPHYDFDYSRMKPNRFAGTELRFKKTPVYLDADVSEVFQTSEAVNTVLRSAIRAMRRTAPKAPGKESGSRKRRAS